MSGEHFKNGVLTARKAGKEQQEYLVIKFTDILVSSFHHVGIGSGDPIPPDEFSLNFAKIEWGYKEQQRRRRPRRRRSTRATTRCRTRSSEP